MIVGYDPHRVGTLASMSREALWSLSTVTSSDPAAANAIGAVRRLHRTIEVGVLAAADDIIRSAPLSCSFGTRTAAVGIRRRHRGEPGPLGPAASRSTPPGTPGILLRDLILRHLSGKLATLTDDELLLRTRTELTAAADASRLIDLDDPVRLTLWAALGAELSRRAGRRADFAERLVEYSLDDPLLALVVAESNMPAEIKVAVFSATVTAGPDRPQDDHLRGRAVHVFLEEFLADPALALHAIGRPGLVAGILDWERRDSAWVALGIDDAVDLVDVAFSSASTYDLGSRDEPGNSEITARSLATLVDLMNSEHGDRGLPAELSAAYTAGLLPLLPGFVNAFDGDEVFRLRRDDMSPVDVELGTTGESMLDLFGGLARHSDSRSMLVGSVAALGPGIGTLYTAEQFAGFAAALGTSMHNEQLEEEIHARRQRDRWTTGLTLLEAGLEAGLEASGSIRPGADAAASIALDVAFDVARWSIDRLVTIGDLHLDDVPRAIEMLVVIALSARIASDLRTGDDHDDPIEAQLDRIDERLTSSDVEAGDLAGEVDLLRDLVDRAIGSNDLDATTRRRVERRWNALDLDAFGEPPFRSEPRVDAEP